MPNKVNLTAPPALRGAADSNVSMLWSWLYQITEQLNVCLNQIDEDNLSEGVRGKLNSIFDAMDDIDMLRRSANGMNNVLDSATKRAISESESSTAQLIEDRIGESSAGMGERIDTVSQTVQGIGESVTELQDGHRENSESIEALESSLTQNTSDLNDGIDGVRRALQYYYGTHDSYAPLDYFVIGYNKLR